MTSKNIKVQDPKNVKDPELNSDNLDLYKQAQSAVAAGLAYTAKRYQLVLSKVVELVGIPTLS